MDVCGDRIKRLSKELGKTQKEIADIVGVNQSTLSGYGRGFKPSVDVLINLSKLFNVSTDYLLGLSPDRKATGGKIQELLDELGQSMKDTQATPIKADAIAALITRYLKYYRTGAPAGDTPVATFRMFVIAMGNALTAASDRDFPRLLDSCNRVAQAGLSANEIMRAYVGDGNVD